MSTWDHWTHQKTPLARVILSCAGIFLAAFLCLSSVYAQEVLKDRDYFDADRNPQTKDLLHVVDAYHLHKEFWDYYSIGDYDNVLPHVRYILIRFPNHPKALTVLSSVAKLTKNPALAIPYYQRALALFPQHALTHAQFGIHLVEIGHINEGVAKLQEAIRMDPRLALAHAWLANAYSKVGEFDLARQAAAQARELGYRGKIPQEGEK